VAAISGSAAWKVRTLAEPPVSWLNTSSGRASASVTSTIASGTPNSSATSMPQAVSMPWPDSARGSSSLMRPSLPTASRTSGMVGSAVCRMASPRS